MAKLVLSAGGTVVNQYFVDKERLGIGRDSHNDIVIDDPAISRDHAVIVTVGNDQIVEDLESSNGTYVNGAQVSRQILQHRDIMEFGAFSLCYLNSKAAADIDFERTMIIAALPRQTDEVPGGAFAVPAARGTGGRWPHGRIQHLAGPSSGQTTDLNRVVTVIGTTGEDTAVITRRPHGYFVTHVAGRRQPAVNQRAIGTDAHLLQDGDMIEIGDVRVEFHLDMPGG